MAADGGPVTDPNLIAQLEKAQQPVVSDPDLIAKLEAAKQPAAASPAAAAPPPMSAADSAKLAIGNAALLGTRLATPTGMAELLGHAGASLPTGIAQSAADVYNLIRGRGVHDPNRLTVPQPPASPSMSPGMPSVGDLMGGLTQGLGGLAHSGYQAVKPSLPASVQTGVHGVAEYGPEVASAAGVVLPAMKMGAPLLSAGARALGNVGARAAVGAGNLLERAIPGEALPPMPPRPSMNPAPASGAGFGADSASAARANEADSLPAPIRAEYEKAEANAPGSGNLDAAQRYADAHELDPRIVVSVGEATRDPAQLRREYEDMNATEQGSKRIQNNSIAIADQLQQAEKDVAGDSAGLDPQTRARKLAEMLADEATQRGTEIKGAYNRLAQFNGGSFPLDLQAVVNNADARLDAEMANAAPQIRGAAPEAAKPQPQLELLRRKAAQQAANDAARAAGQTVSAADEAAGSLSVPEFTATIKALSREQRTGADPFSAGVVRDALQELPLRGGDAGVTAQVKTARDYAASLAKDNFDRLGQDPAYREVVNHIEAGRPVNDLDLDGFMKRHFTDVPGIQATLQTLGGNDEAAQLIAGYRMNQAVKAARLDAQSGQTGKLATTSLGNELQAHGAALEAAVGPNASARTQLALRVARTLTPDYASAGANLSRSGTNAADRFGQQALQVGAQTAADLTQHALNAAAPGAGTLMGIGRKLVGIRSETRAAQAAAAEKQAFIDNAINTPYAGVHMAAPGSMPEAPHIPVPLRLNPFPPPPGRVGPIPPGGGPPLPPGFRPPPPPNGAGPRGGGPPPLPPRPPPTPASSAAPTLPPVPPRNNAAASAVTHSVQDERGQPLQVFTSPNGGQLRAYVDGQRLKVKDVGIDQQHRGKGEGVAMYQEAAKWAQQHGLTLASDYTVSADAAGVWNALAKRGYNVVRNPDAMTNGGIIYHGMRQPVFELRGGPPAAPASQQLPPTLPRAATPQSAPTMTGEQAQNIVAGMPPQWRQAAIKSIGDAHRMLSREQGAGTVSIADLQQRTGIPLPQLHALLLSQSKLGRLSLTGQTSAEGSAAATNGAGVTVPGVSGPRVAVTMPQSAPMPPSAARQQTIMSAVQDLQSGPGNYVTVTALRQKLGNLTDAEVMHMADQGKLALIPDGSPLHSKPASARITDDAGQRFNAVQIPQSAPTAPVQVGKLPPQLAPGRTAGGSAIPSAPSSAVTPANIIDAMRQVEPRVEKGLSVKIPDLARQLGVTPQQLAEHLRPLGEKGILDMHTHPWPDRLTAEDRAQLPSNGNGGYYDAVTIRRGAKLPGGTPP